VQVKLVFEAHRVLKVLPDLYEKVWPLESLLLFSDIHAIPRHLSAYFYVALH